MRSIFELFDGPIASGAPEVDIGRPEKGVSVNFCCQIIKKYAVKILVIYLEKFKISTTYNSYKSNRSTLRPNYRSRLLIKFFLNFKRTVFLLFLNNIQKYDHKFTAQFG